MNFFAAASFRRASALGNRPAILVKYGQFQRHTKTPLTVARLAGIPRVTRPQMQIRILPRNLQPQISLCHRVVGQRGENVRPRLQRNPARITRSQRRDVGHRKIKIQFLAFQGGFAQPKRLGQARTRVNLARAGIAQIKLCSVHCDLSGHDFRA